MEKTKLNNGQPTFDDKITNVFSKKNIVFLAVRPETQVSPGVENIYSGLLLQLELL